MKEDFLSKAIQEMTWSERGGTDVLLLVEATVVNQYRNCLQVASIFTKVMLPETKSLR